MKVITNRFQDQSLLQILNAQIAGPVQLRAAVAYFTSKDLIEQVMKIPGSTAHLIVALSPPTDYFVLKSIYWQRNIRVDFIRSGLHSKLYIVNTADSVIVTIGSSNLTSGGLSDNIETNVLLHGAEVEQHGIYSHFKFIEQQSERLTPEVLENYKSEYDDFMKKNGGIKRPSQQPPQTLRTPAAKSYIDFWNEVDHVRELVKDRAELRFPNLPTYISVDHFWHYIVSIRRQEEVQNLIRQLGQEKAIKRLFEQYADWDAKSNGFSEVLANRIEIIQSLLNKTVIHQLTMNNVVRVYECLHSADMPNQRFHRKEKFSKENSIKDVISNFYVLLHSDQRIEYRIDAALTKHKIRWFGKSGVQELNGWMYPDKYPIRNAKADKALEILGLRHGDQFGS